MKDTLSRIWGITSLGDLRRARMNLGTTQRARTYEPYSPEEIGRERKLVFGKYSGRNLIKKVLEEKGIHFEDVALDESLQVIKETHERKEMEWKKENNALLEELHRLMRKRSTTDDEAIEIAKKVMNQ